MKINVGETQRRRLVERVEKAMVTSQTIWEILTLKTLHEEFGFGEKRLKDFAKAQQENYIGFSREADMTDSYKRESVATNLDTALIRAIMALRRDGIDYREILGCENKLYILGEGDEVFSVDDHVEKLLEKERERREGK